MVPRLCGRWFLYQLREQKIGTGGLVWRWYIRGGYRGRKMKRLLLRLFNTLMATLLDTLGYRSALPKSERAWMSAFSPLLVTQSYTELHRAGTTQLHWCQTCLGVLGARSSIWASEFWLLDAHSRSDILLSFSPSTDLDGTTITKESDHRHLKVTVSAISCRLTFHPRAPPA